MNILLRVGEMSPGRSERETGKILKDEFHTCDEFIAQIHRIDCTIDHRP